MAKLLQLLAILLAISTSLAVPFGEICHPLIPQYWCDSGLNLKCTQEPNGVHTCQCNTGYLINDDGKSCGATLEYSCDSTQEINCNADRGLWCMTLITQYGKCICKDSWENFFSDELQTCARIVGGPCDPNTSPDDIFGHICLPHGTCNPETNTCECKEGFEAPEGLVTQCVKINGTLGSPCQSNEDCDYTTHRLECSEERRCDCAKSQGYHLTRPGVCVKGYGDSCSILDQCDYYRFQFCSSETAWPGECECLHTWEMEYNPVDDRCGALVGNPCGPSGGNQGIGCVMNAECVQHNLTSYTCECNPGFLPAIDRRSCVQGPNGIEIL